MRKHILTSLLMTAALTLSLVSCQREEVLNGGVLQDVSISVLVPDNQLVKSNADPGNASEINRCILEIYDGQGQIVGSRQTVAVTNNSADFTATLTIGSSYKFVFWADHVADAADLATDLNYITTDLSAITYAENAFKNNNDQMDAFFLSETKAVEASMSFDLKRPFGQVNFISTTGINTNLDAEAVKVTFAKAPTTFNAIDGTRGTETATLAPVDFTAFANTTATNAGERHLTFDYIFADPDAEDQTLVDVTFETEGTLGLEPISVNNVPVQRNYRTNLKGNILPEQTGTEINIDVTIQPGFDGDQEFPLPEEGGEENPYDPGDLTATEVEVTEAALNFYGTTNGTQNHYYNLTVNTPNNWGYENRFNFDIYSKSENHTEVPAGTYRFSKDADIENTFCLTESSVNWTYVPVIDGVLTIDENGAIFMDVTTETEDYEGNVTRARYTVSYTGDITVTDYTVPDPNFPESTTMAAPTLKVVDYGYPPVVGNIYNINLEINDAEGTGYVATLNLYAGLNFNNGVVSFVDEEFNFIVKDNETQVGAGDIILGEHESYVRNNNTNADTDVKGGTLSVNGNTVSGTLILQGDVEISFNVANEIDLNGQTMPTPGSNVSGAVDQTYDGEVNAYAYLYADCWHITIAPKYQFEGPAVSLDLLHGGLGSTDDISGTYTCATTGEANTFYPGCIYPESYPTAYGVVYYHCKSAGYNGGDYATINEGTVTITQTDIETPDQWTINATCDIVISGKDPNNNDINITYSNIIINISDNSGTSWLAF